MEEGHHYDEKQKDAVHLQQNTTQEEIIGENNRQATIEENLKNYQTQEEMLKERAGNFSDFDSLPKWAKDLGIEEPIGLVLDQSGSMGRTRCLYQEKGVKSFIEVKRDKDAISVLKFDENVNTEILLNDSKNTLLSSLIIDGGKAFGGSTALYDGIYEGITENIVLDF